MAIETAERYADRRVPHDAEPGHRPGPPAPAALAAAHRTSPARAEPHRADAPGRDDRRSPIAPIWIVHPSRLFRDCLTRALERDVGCEVRDFSDLDEIDQRIGTGPLALLIVGLPAGSAPSGRLEAMLHDLHDRVAVVVTGESEEPRLVASLLEMGARAYVPTSMDLGVTIQALRLVLAGGTFAPASCLLRLTRIAASPTDRTTGSEGLTAKQLAVIEAIRKGKANKTIAYELNMCESTVKVHVRNIMKKLHAKNRTQVAYIANQLLSELSTPESGYDTV